MVGMPLVASSSFVLSSKVDSDSEGCTDLGKSVKEPGKNRGDPKAHVGVIDVGYGVSLEQGVVELGRKLSIDHFEEEVQN
jgi:hypothetical protein